MEEEDRRDLLAEEGADDEEQELDNIATVRSRPRKARGRAIARGAPPPQRCGRCKTTCAHGLCTILLMLVAGSLCLAVGLFVGQSIGRRDAGGDATPPTTPGPTPSTVAVEYDWGDMVKDKLGRKKEVMDIFKGGINESDISAYLQ